MNADRPPDREPAENPERITYDEVTKIIGPMPDEPDPDEGLTTEEIDARIAAEWAIHGPPDIRTRCFGCGELRDPGEMCESTQDESGEWMHMTMTRCVYCRRGGAAYS